MYDVASPQTQSSWLAYLEQRCEAQPIQLGLARIKQVATRLGVTGFDVPVIMVAGTNGKGSTVKALESIYQQAGYCVGVYTSPHLLRFNERIVVGRQAITEFSLCEAFAAVYQAEQGCILTYFEFTTLAALWFFKHAQPDVIVLEVGLGGRLDATNIIDADLAILTTIDFDHEAYLGNTLEAIGFEKAGIFRKGQLAIFASGSAPESVLRVAQQLQINLVRFEQDYHATLTTKYHFVSDNFEWTCGMPHLHPQALSAAIMATRLLQGRLPVAREDYQALESASLMGRLQQIPGKVDILLDVSHNRQSVKRLAEFLAAHPRGGKIHAVFSALKDKAIADMVASLASQVHCWHIAPIDAKRAASLMQLKTACDDSGSTVLCYNSLSSAFEGAQVRSCAEDLIVVFGSFYTVAEVLTHLSVH